MVNRVRIPDCAPKRVSDLPHLLSPRLMKELYAQVVAEMKCAENDAGCRRDYI